MLVTAFTTGCLFAACGGAAEASHSSSTKPTTPTVSSRSTSKASSSVAVLAAYRAGWAAYDQALADANPNDAELGKTMVDPLLQRVRANLLGYQRDGIVGRGSVQLHPKISSLSSGSATVVDCMFSSSELVYSKTGQPVPPVTKPEHDGVRATLTLVGGTWKVSQQSVTEGTCPAGS